MEIMQGFPPPEAARATLANWRQRPWSAWAFHHVREIVPTAGIDHDPAEVWALEQGAALLDAGTLEALLAPLDWDALVVVQGGAIRHEMYRNGMGPSDPHILMSVSKSLTALVAGCLEGQGVLDTGAALTDYLPELAGTAFAGATVRDALDMRVGVAFDEDYTARDGQQIAYRRAMNWLPADPGADPVDLRSFLQTLTVADGRHGGRFHYVSPVTDALGWACERAAGRRLSELISELLWRPMGAEHAACITVDRIGGMRAAGGICTSARDLARLGLLMARGGRRGDRQVIPGAWLRDIVANADPEAWAVGDFAEKFAGYDMAYRSKWYVHRGQEPLVHGQGIHGQYLFADAARDLSVALMSSQADPVDLARTRKVFELVAALRAAV